MQNTNEEIVPVQDGEIVKLQKPLDNTFSNKERNNDGIILGTCDNCNAENVNVEDHICKSIVELPKQMVTTLEAFKILLEKDEKDYKGKGINGEAEYQSGRLLSKYGIDAFNDAKKIYKNWKDKELEDAISYIVDIIYDSENIKDNEWEYIVPVLKNKIKEQIFK